MYCNIYAFNIAFENSFEVSTRLTCFNNLVSVKVHVEFASLDSFLWLNVFPAMLTS